MVHFARVISDSPDFHCTGRSISFDTLMQCQGYPALLSTPDFATLQLVRPKTTLRRLSTCESNLLTWWSLFDAGGGHLWTA